MIRPRMCAAAGPPKPEIRWRANAAWRASPGASRWESQAKLKSSSDQAAPGGFNSKIRVGWHSIRACKGENSAIKLMGNGGISGQKNGQRGRHAREVWNAASRQASPHLGDKIKETMEEASAFVAKCRAAPGHVPQMVKRGNSQSAETLVNDLITIFRKTV